MHGVARASRRVAEADDAGWRLKIQGARHTIAVPRVALRRCLRTLLTLALFSAPALSHADSAGATINITAPTVTLPYSASSQSGNFEIYVQASGSSLPQVGEFTVDVQLPGITGLNFVVASNPTPTTHPYIFSGQTPAEMFGGANNTNNQIILGTDFASNPPTLADNDGLLLVGFQAAAGVTGYFPLTLVPYSGSNPAGTALQDQNGAVISSTLMSGSISIPTPTAYWSGAINGAWTTDLFDSNHTGATNWTIDSAGATDTHIAPSATTDVFFNSPSAGNLSTTLGADFSIKGLTFTSTATSPVTIGGANTLTIGADGLTVQSGSAVHTINSAVTLTGTETWNIANSPSSPLSIGGTLRTGGGTWTKSGGGTVRVNSPPTLTNGTTLNVAAGTLEFNLSSAVSSLGSGVTAVVASGATLELAGTAPALALGTTHVPIQNNATAASGGGLVVIGTGQQVGAITGSGTTTLGAGAKLTADSIQQSALVIGAGAVFTLDPSDSSGHPLTPAASGSSLTTLLGADSAFASGLTSNSAALAETTSNGAAPPLNSTLAPANSVPEPSAILLAAVGSLLALGRLAARRHA